MGVPGERGKISLSQDLESDSDNAIREIPNKHVRRKTLIPVEKIQRTTKRSLNNPLEVSVGNQDKAEAHVCCRHNR